MGVCWAGVKRIILFALLTTSCLGPILPLPEIASDATSVRASKAALPAARVSQLSAGEQAIPGDRSDGRSGDYRLENDRVVVVVSAIDHLVGGALSGGNIIDAAPRGHRDALQQVYGSLGEAPSDQPMYQEIEMRQHGKTALLVARGHAASTPSLAIETTYSLTPGAAALAVTTVVTNRGASPLSHFAIGDTVEWGRAQRFIPGKGFGGSGRFPIAAGWLEGLGEDSAYAYVVAEGPLEGRHGASSSTLLAAEVDLPPGARVEVSRWLVVAGAADRALFQSVARLRKARWDLLSGRLLDESTGAPLAGALVFFDDREGPFAITRATLRGYEVALPTGDYRVRAEGLGSTGADQLEVSVGAIARAHHDVVVATAGRLVYEVRDEKGLSPAKLTFIGLPPTPSPRLGPLFANPGGPVAVSASGQGELRLPPGHYRVVASRGPEYSLDEVAIAVPSGGEARAEFELHRVVDAFGWRCVDPHQHASPAADSAVALADRAASNLAEGLDTMVVIDALASQTAALEAAGRPSILLGSESWLKGLGHFTVIPPPPHPVGANRPHARAAGLRELGAPNRVVILDRPTSHGRIGREDAAEGTLLASAADQIDAFEIWSGKDPSGVEPLLRDWMALLDRGLTFTAVGGSNSRLIADEEVGYPRTCFPSSGPVTAEGFVAAVKKRREALVTNGPFIRVSVAGRGIGQLAPAPKGRARLELAVQAAPWVDVRRLEIFVNGSRRGRPIVVAPSTAPLRYQGSVELRIERDAYVVVVARGDAPLGAVVTAEEGESPPTPLAITNPIYLDRDGDGRYRAPEATELR